MEPKIEQLRRHLHLQDLAILAQMDLWHPVVGTDFMVGYQITGGKLISITPDVDANSLIIASMQQMMVN